MFIIKMRSLVIIACVLSCVHVLFCQEKVTYNGNQLWKIQKTNQTMKVLTKLQKNNYLSVWGSDTETIHAMIHASHVDHAKTALADHNLAYEITIFDIQKAIDLENPKQDDERDDRNGLRFNWKYYHRLEDIYSYLDYLSLTFPELCSTQTIGKTAENREIRLIKISNGDKKNKAIFIDGGIHAREWISPASVTYVINHIVFNAEDSFLRNIDWYIVPVLNPDGYEYSHTIDRLWRKNRANYGECTGVDLNRNFGYQWNISGGASSNPCQNTHRGKKPFSEEETSALANFFKNNANVNWKGFISVHSYGQYIVYPWSSSNDIIRDHQELELVGKKAIREIILRGGAFYTTGPTASTIYPASGSSMDWARGVLGIKYVYTIELRDTGRFGFLLPAVFIKATAEEALIAIKTIAEAVRTDENL